MDKLSNIPYDKPLIKRIEQKGNKVISQGKDIVKGPKEIDYESDNLGSDEDYLTYNKDDKD